MLLSINVVRPDLPSHQYRTLVLRCDACLCTFTHKYKKTYAEKQRHFCCQRCAGVGKRINVDVSRVRHLICEVCQTPFDRVCNTNQRDPRTCTHSCASSLVSRELNLAQYMNTLQAQANAKRSLQKRYERWQNGEEIHPLTDRVRGPISDDHRQKLRNANGGENNAMFGKHHTEEALQKMREARSKLIIEGKMNWSIFGHKSGSHLSSKMNKNMHFRSSWEEAVMIWLDDSPNIIAWDYECVRIPYYYNDNKRWYVPDFIVTFKDGHREMWEVKPREFVTAEKTQLKIAAGREYCQQQCIQEYVILSRQDLETRGIV